MADRISISTVDCGAMPNQALVDARVNVFALHMLIESIQKSGLFDAMPSGVSFTLATNDVRHQGIRITITPDALARPLE